MCTCIVIHNLIRVSYSILSSSSHSLNYPLSLFQMNSPSVSINHISVVKASLKDVNVIGGRKVAEVFVILQFTSRDYSSTSWEIVGNEREIR